MRCAARPASARSSTTGTDRYTCCDGRGGARHDGNAQMGSARRPGVVAARHDRGRLRAWLVAAAHAARGVLPCDRAGTCGRRPPAALRRVAGGRARAGVEPVHRRDRRRRPVLHGSVVTVRRHRDPRRAQRARGALPGPPAAGAEAAMSALLTETTRALGQSATDSAARTAVGAVAIAVLLLVLVTREMARAELSESRARRLAKLRFVTLPLTLVFAGVVAPRIVELLH